MLFRICKFLSHVYKGLVKAYFTTHTACTKEADMAFEGLKKAFTSAPVLAHVDHEKAFIIEANASDFALGSILSQQDNNEKLHP